MRVSKPLAVGITGMGHLSQTKIAGSKPRADITDEHLNGFIQATGFPADLELTDEIRRIIKNNLIHTRLRIGKRAWRYLIEHGCSTSGLQKVKDNKAQPRRK